MLQNRLLRLSVLAGAAGLLIGCSDRAANPAGPATGGLVQAVTLGRSAALNQPITVAVLVDSTGGEIRIRETGLRVQIPAGAVSSPTVITATALPGKSFAYEFGPHGTTFQRPLVMQQELESGRLGLLSRASTRLEIGYFASVAQLDASAGQVLVNEFLPVETDASRNAVRWQVSHFSGYVISMGRSRSRGWDRGDDDL